MKIKKIIDFLESQGVWVNREHTRDHVLVGETETEVNKVFVCWVATLDVIHQAIDKNCHFIITHENPFYLSSTSMPTSLWEERQAKKKLCQEHQITIYRCHDLWDLYPKYGVRDSWATLLDIPFQEANQGSFVRVSENIHTKVSSLAKHIAERIAPLYEFGVTVIGNLDQDIHCLGIGTGACTDIIEMYNKGADVCLVSDDGINNWVYTQWAMDKNIPLIVVNHLTSEAQGILQLSKYLSQNFSNIDFQYIYNDYGIHHIEKHVKS